MVMSYNANVMVKHRRLGVGLFLQKYVNGKVGIPGANGHSVNLISLNDLSQEFITGLVGQI